MTAARNQQKGEGVAHDPLGLLPPRPCPGRWSTGGAPRAAQVGKAHHDGDDGQRQPQARQSQMPGEPPQVDAVHHAVQHVDELGSVMGSASEMMLRGMLPTEKSCSLLATDSFSSLQFRFAHAGFRPRLGPFRPPRSPFGWPGKTTGLRPARWRPQWAAPTYSRTGERARP